VKEKWKFWVSSERYHKIKNGMMLFEGLRKEIDEERSKHAPHTVKMPDILMTASG
jgi:hypothetical protein